MNADQFKGRWTQLKGKVKSQWGKITDDDIKEVNGSREELAGKLQARYGRSKEDAKREVDSFIDSL